MLPKKGYEKSEGAVPVREQNLTTSNRNGRRAHLTMFANWYSEGGEREACVFGLLMHPWRGLVQKAFLSPSICSYFSTVTGPHDQFGQLTFFYREVGLLGEGWGSTNKDCEPVRLPPCWTANLICSLLVFLQSRYLLFQKHSPNTEI